MIPGKGPRARNRKSDQALKPALSFLLKDDGIVGRKGKEDPSNVSNRCRQSFITRHMIDEEAGSDGNKGCCHTKEEIG